MAEPSPRPLRVLVVDDCCLAADMMAALVASWGHDAWVAYDGLEALGSMAASLSDVVLLNTALPDISGHEVARCIRQHPSMAGVLLIALTRDNGEADRRASREAGFDHHLSKPVYAGHLQKLLSGHASVACGLPGREPERGGRGPAL